MGSNKGRGIQKPMQDKIKGIGRGRGGGQRGRAKANRSVVNQASEEIGSVSDMDATQ